MPHSDSDPGAPRPVQRLLADLKRRQVFRVAAMYGAAGFVVVQAADVFVPALRLPPAVTTTVALLVILGFPLALVAAWALEWTAEGVKRATRALPGELEAISSESASRRWPIGLAALVGAGLIGLSAWWLARGEIGEGQTYESIAVLPLANLSGNAEFDYFGEGMAEELQSALSGLDGLRVAARTSSFAFRGTDTDIRTIADSLGVVTILEGSVRRSPDRVRVNLQLVEAEQGFQLWSREYDRPLDDLLALQDEIAASVVAALQPRLRGEDVAQRGGTSDVIASDEYMLGRQKWHTRQVPALREAVGHFRTAVTRDTGFALGWSGLADAIDALAFRDTAALALVPEGRSAALRALTLDPLLAEAWASAGVIASEFDLDRATGERALRRALELSPSYAHANQQLGGVLRNMGRVEESRPYFERGVQLDPLSPLIRGGMALMRIIAADTAGARSDLEVAAQLSPSTYRNALVWYSARLGMTADEAEDAAEAYAVAVGLEDPRGWRLVGRAMIEPEGRAAALDFLAAQEAVDRFDRHQFELALGDYEAAIAYLQESFALGTGDQWRIGTQPQYDPLRDDPRFIEIVRALRIPNGYDPVTRRARWP